MAFRKTPAFDAPIAGQSLTAEPKNRPWRNPPQLDTVEDAMEYYLPRLSSSTFANRLLDVIERGVPLTALAEIIVTAGAMEGVHSIDVGMLVAPILVEFMKNMAELAEVEYNLGDVDKGESDLDPQLIDKAMATLKTNNNDIEDMETKEEVIPQEQPLGLMTRRESI